MNTKHPTTAFVPVTIQLPPALAEKLQRTNYNFESLLQLVIGDYNPRDLAEWLLDLHFDYSRLLMLNAHEITPNSVEYLHACQQTIRAIQQMEQTSNRNTADYGADRDRTE